MTAWMPIDHMNIDLEIQRATTSVTPPEDEHFLLWAKTTLENECTLAIRIVDEEEGQRFNREYRGKDYATNVLSFASELPAGLPSEIKQSQLGDLLICAPVVAREAKEQGKPEADHWAHLTIHGILHLMGYDHEQSADTHVMETLETEILAKLDIPDPYQKDT